MSGDDSASTPNKDDNALFKARGKRIKIKLEKILNNQGLFAPSALNGGVEFNFKTPDASDIMIAQSGESVGGYALKEPKLQRPRVWNMVCGRNHTTLREKPI